MSLVGWLVVVELSFKECWSATELLSARRALLLPTSVSRPLTPLLLPSIIIELECCNWSRSAAPKLGTADEGTLTPAIFKEFLEFWFEQLGSVLLLLMC